jgi:hypothetical protein
MSTPTIGTRSVPVQYIDVELLEVEADCQRPLNATRAGKIASHWDADLAGSIHVAEFTKDDGTIGYYVLDGWTRRSAARLAGETEILCHVHKGLSKTQRAEKFLRLNEDTVKPGKMDHHRIGVSADRLDALTIDRVLATYGLKIAGSPSKNNVAAVAGCYSALSRGGEAPFGEAIRVIQAAWGTYGGDQWKGEFIVGVTRLIEKNPTLDTSRLIKVMSKITPDRCTAEILERSKGSGGSGGRPIHLEAYLKERYNSGLRSHRLS